MQGGKFKNQIINLLVEKQGILEYESSDYEDLLNLIINDIKDTSFTDIVTLNYNNEFIDNFNLLTYSKTDICWLKTLNILIKFDDNEENYFTITKTGFTINNKNCFIISNNRIEIGTIVLIFPYNQINYLKSILRHELKHLFYNLKTNISIDKFNKDIRFLESYNFKFKYSLDEYLQNFLMTNNFDLKYTEDFIVHSLYYINLNECRAHLENIYQDFRDNLSNNRIKYTAKIDSKIKHIDYYHMHMMYLSNIYLIYYLIFKIYKQLFGLSVNIEHIRNELFDIYGIKSFKQFCNFVIKRLNEEILIKAEKLYLSLQK